MVEITPLYGTIWNAIWKFLSSVKTFQLVNHIQLTYQILDVQCQTGNVFVLYEPHGYNLIDPPLQVLTARPWRTPSRRTASAPSPWAAWPSPGSPSWTECNASSSSRTTSTWRTGWPAPPASRSASSRSWTSRSTGWAYRWWTMRRVCGESWPISAFPPVTSSGR